jgi:hypothetical protein
MDGCYDYCTCHVTYFAGNFDTKTVVTWFYPSEPSRRPRLNEESELPSAFGWRIVYGLQSNRPI